MWFRAVAHYRCFFCSVHDIVVNCSGLWFMLSSRSSLSGRIRFARFLRRTPRSHYSQGSIQCLMSKWNSGRSRHRTSSASTIRYICFIISILKFYKQRGTSVCEKRFFFGVLSLNISCKAIYRPVVCFMHY